MWRSLDTPSPHRTPVVASDLDQMKYVGRGWCNWKAAIAVRSLFICHYNLQSDFDPTKLQNSTLHLLLPNGFVFYRDRFKIINWNKNVYKFFSISSCQKILRPVSFFHMHSAHEEVEFKTTCLYHHINECNSNSWDSYSYLKKYQLK